MANYVHNYIFCGEDAKNYVLSPEAAFSEDLCGRYDPLVEPLGNDRFLVTFDTWGMEYRQAFITPFIERYKDSVWYGIEENEAYQGSFRWNGTTVDFSERKLVQTAGDNEIFIRYLDAMHRPYVSVFISDKEIFIEHFLRNKAAKYRFHDDTSTRINLFMDTLIRNVIDHVEYAIPYKNGIEREILTHWCKKDYFIESYSEDDDWQLLVENGETRFEHMIKFLEKILKYEAINEKISFEVFNDFLV